MPPSVPTTTQQPTPSLAIARRGGFLSSFFSSQRTPTTTTSHVGSSLSSASIVDPQKVITNRWGLSLPLHLPRHPQQPPTTPYGSRRGLLPPPHPPPSPPDEFFRPVGGPSPPSTCDTSLIDPLLSSSPLSLVASVLYKYIIYLIKHNYIFFYLQKTRFKPLNW